MGRDLHASVDQLSPMPGINNLRHVSFDCVRDPKFWQIDCARNLVNRSHREVVGSALSERLEMGAKDTETAIKINLFAKKPTGFNPTRCSQFETVTRNHVPEDETVIIEKSPDAKRSVTFQSWTPVERSRKLLFAIEKEL